MAFNKIGAVVACASLVSATTQSYQVTDEYTADNFFDKFDFFVSTYTSGDSWDATHGYVQYKSQADAESMGLISSSNGQVYIGPDTNSTYDPTGTGRESVRITSKATYNEGLLIANFSHMPVQACGAWPAFWSYGSPWLTSGEIDFYEGWNLMGYNRMAMHTNGTLAGACTLASEATDILGSVLTDDCVNDETGTGCGVETSNGVWGSTVGATIAMEWTDTFIKVWSWLPADVPSDITAGKPNPSPSAWGLPQLLAEHTACDLTESFKNLQLVFDIDFCGDTAGSPAFWNATCSSVGSSCASYVAENPSAFAETYFLVDGIKFYEMQPDTTTTTAAVASSTTVISSSVAATTTSSSAATTTTTNAGLLAGTGSVLDSTLGVSSTSAQIAAISATLVEAAPTSAHSHTTSYIYATSTSTDESGSETTVVVVVDTTICPVTASEAAATSSLAAVSSAVTTETPAVSPTAVVAASPSASEASLTTIYGTGTSTLTSTSTILYSTSTLYSTLSTTVSGTPTTVVVAISTTICPVTAAEASASGKPSAATSKVSAIASAPATTITKISKSASIAASSTETETATDTTGPLEMATGTPTGDTAAYGSITETLSVPSATSSLNGTTTSATSSDSAASATSSASCEGLDCIVVSSSGSRAGVGAFGLAMLAGAAIFVI